MSSSPVDSGPLKTACPLDCPDLCALEVTVAEGRVTKITGSAEHPITAGFICRKVRHYGEHAYGEDRLTTPLVRTGGKGAAEFARVSWDEALNRVTAAIQRVRQAHGGEAILPYCYGGSNGKLTQDSVDARLFRRLGASQLARTVCAAPTGAAFGALYGKMPGVAFPDYTKAGLVVVWGCNPNASGIHLVPFINAAQKAGAKLVVVDPRRTPLAHQADLHIPVFPGTDVVVALGLINWLFAEGRADREFLDRHTEGAGELARRASEWPLERAADVSRVPLETLTRFAELYAEAAPAVIRCGWGLERNRNGGSAVAAVLALPAVAGKFGVPGGGFTMSNSSSWQLGVDDMVAERGRPTRVINMNRLGRELLEQNDPPIDLLFVYNANPLATVPDQLRIEQGLRREDLFTVVFDQVLTDTARFADVVLPATTFLEHTDYRVGYGTGHLAKVNPVIEPVGEARPNYEVFAELCSRLGLASEGDATTLDELAGRLLEPVDADREDRLARDGWVPPPSGENPVQFRDVFPNTADRKIRLVPAELDEQAPSGLYAYLPPRSHNVGPLVLLSPSTNSTISSTLGQCQDKPATLLLHPTAADARNLPEGGQVRVFNDFGEVRCHVERDDNLAPGVAVLPKGLWRRQSLNGNTANALVGDEPTDIAEGACFNDARVEVEAL